MTTALPSVFVSPVCGDQLQGWCAQQYVCVGAPAGVLAGSHTPFANEDRVPLFFPHVFLCAYERVCTVSRAAPKPTHVTKGQSSSVPLFGPGRPTGARAAAFKAVRQEAAAKARKEQAEVAAQQKFFAAFKQPSTPAVPSPAPVAIIGPVGAAAASDAKPHPSVTRGMCLCVQLYITATAPCHRVPVPSSFLSHRWVSVWMGDRPGCGVWWCFGFLFRVSNKGMPCVLSCGSGSTLTWPRRLATVCPFPHPSFLIAG